MERPMDRSTFDLAVELARKRRRLFQTASKWKKVRILQLTLALLRLQRERSAAISQGKKDRRWWVRPILQDHDIHGAWASLIPTLRETDPEGFHNFMRMWPEHFDELLEMVSPFITKCSKRKPICAGERLAITLRKLATGDSNKSLSYLFRVSDQVISNILLEVCQTLWKVISTNPEFFEVPSEDFWLRKAAEFQCMWNFPHCIGAIDGVHIQIKAFPHTGAKYFNYKKHFSVNVMAVADAKQRFIIVESGSPGSCGDAGVFMRSKLASMMDTGALEIPEAIPVDGIEGTLPFMFVDDNAYPRGVYMQTPFKGQFLQPEEYLFNYRLSRARRSSENAFGILEKRLSILQGPIEGDPPFVMAVVLACFALHNFHLKREQSIPPCRRKYRPPGYVDCIGRDGLSPQSWKR